MLEIKYYTLTVIFKDNTYAYLISDDKNNELALSKCNDYKTLIEEVNRHNYKFEYIIIDTQALFIVNYLNVSEDCYIKEIFHYEKEMEKEMPSFNLRDLGILTLIREVSIFYNSKLSFLSPIP